jgi:hypothetical protein
MLITQSSVGLLQYSAYAHNAYCRDRKNSMHYEIYATPNLSRYRDICDLRQMCDHKLFTIYASTCIIPRKIVLTRSAWLLLVLLVARHYDKHDRKVVE